MDNFDTALVQVKKENQNYKTGSNIILTCHPREVIQLIHCSADRCLELEVKEHTQVCATGQWAKCFKSMNVTATLFMVEPHCLQ